MSSSPFWTLDIQSRPLSGQVMWQCSPTHRVPALEDSAANRPASLENEDSSNDLHRAAYGRDPKPRLGCVASLLWLDHGILSH